MKEENKKETLKEQLGFHPIFLPIMLPIMFIKRIFEVDLLLGICFVLIMIGFFGIFREAIYLQAKLETGYTIKVLDSQGNAIQIYKSKTYQFYGNRLYLCPKGTANCSNYQDAIIISGSYIIEPEN